jgi:hypothetical protein
MLHKSMSPQRFILTAIDPEYGHPAFETMFVVERPDELRGLLNIDAKVDPDFERVYWLEAHEGAAVARHFRLGFDPEGRQTILSKWTTAVGGPPYLGHTGFELVLMIDGRKQFARMHGDFYPPMHFDDEELFDRCVSQGLLHKEEELEQFPKPMQLKDGRVIEGLRTVYFTRKGEEWRIPAWKLISRASRKSGWNEHFERLEGMLFGYEDWQNDWWIEDIRKRRLRWGTTQLYLAVTADELSGIEQAGYRALPHRRGDMEVVMSMSDEEGDEEPRRLLEAVGAVALVRFRVKVRPFLDLVDHKQARTHVLPSDRLKDLNRLIIDEIEIVARREGAPA